MCIVGKPLPAWELLVLTGLFFCRYVPYSVVDLRNLKVVNCAGLLTGGINGVEKLHGGPKISGPEANTFLVHECELLWPFFVWILVCFVLHLLIFL